MEVLPSLLVPENKAGYNALRKALTKISPGSPLVYFYTYDLQMTVGRKFAYADDLAILHYASDW